MDTKLNMTRASAHNEKLRQRAELVRSARSQREWPDDGLPARFDRSRNAVPQTTHPAAVVGAMLAWR